MNENYTKQKYSRDHIVLPDSAGRFDDEVDYNSHKLYCAVYLKTMHDCCLFLAWYLHSPSTERPS